MAPKYDITTPGKRLLPHIVDERARSGYVRPFALYPRSKVPGQGFREVSYAQLANAVNRAAWWLEAEITREEEREKPVAYLGPNDLRYIIFVLATMKTGRKILFPSLRNTVDAQFSLFEKLNCKVLVTCPSLAQPLKPLLSAPGKVRKIQAPTLDEFLSDEPVPHYSYDKTFDSVSDKPLGFLHTSGSSGNPKPISWNMKFINALDSVNILPAGQGTSLTKAFTEHQRTLVLLPCFHGGGLGFNFYAAFFEMTLVLGHPDVPISAHYVSQLLKQGVITALLSPPSILDELSKDPYTLPDLAKLQHVGYGGGPLHPETGKMLAPLLLHLFSFIGATEYGWFHLLSGGNERWDCLKFYEGVGYRFDEVSSGIWELVIVKDSKTDKFHGIFEVFPDIAEYRTRDLYQSKEDGWWQYQGRTDDLIVLSNGEKINPIPMEQIIQGHPAVKAALVVGDHRFNPSLLVEMEDDHIPKTKIEIRERLNQIWLLVEEANKVAPEFAKIPKSLILFATAEKPFLRAGKGTVQRQNTVKSHAKELDSLFSSQEDSLLTEGLTLGKLSSQESIIKTFTREIYSQALAVKDLEDNDDVFERGMDSLHVELIVQRLRAALKASDAPLDLETVDTRLVYSATSINQMAEALVGMIERSSHARGGRLSSKL